MNMNKLIAVLLGIILMLLSVFVGVFLAGSQLNPFSAKTEAPVETTTKSPATDAASVEEKIIGNDDDTKDVDLEKLAKDLKNSQEKSMFKAGDSENLATAKAQFLNYVLTYADEYNGENFSYENLDLLFDGTATSYGHRDKGFLLSMKGLGRGASDEEIMGYDALNNCWFAMKDAYFDKNNNKWRLKLSFAKDVHDEDADKGRWIEKSGAHVMNVEVTVHNMTEPGMIYSVDNGQKTPLYSRRKVDAVNLCVREMLPLYKDHEARKNK